MGYAFVNTLEKALKIRREDEHTLNRILGTALRERDKEKLSNELLDITQLYLTKLIEPLEKRESAGAARKRAERPA